MILKMVGEQICMLLQLQINFTEHENNVHGVSQISSALFLCSVRKMLTQIFFQPGGIEFIFMRVFC